MPRTARRRHVSLDGLSLILVGLGVLIVVNYLRAHPAQAITLGVLAGAAAVAWATRARWRRAWNTRGQRAAVRMSPRQFEEHIAELLRTAGHREVQVCGGAGDLGADVTATDRHGRKVVVQCKRYGPANPVGSAAMQQFVGTARPHHDADVALFVTTGRFTQPALDYAREHQVFTLDGAGLDAWRRSGVYPWA